MIKTPDNEHLPQHVAIIMDGNGRWAKQRGLPRSEGHKQGAKVFKKGDAGDELFLVRCGSVRIMLPLERGKHHHIATVGRGDFFGELSFLDRGVRSADVEAKMPTELYVLSRARFDAQAQLQAEVGVQVFAHLALAIAHRLRQTDHELQALEER